MKMRELEERTGVHRETIRVYLRHELIPPPVRPRKTVADYGEEHVQAINAVRRLQTDSRLTLPQIKALLSGDAADQRVSANVFTHLEQLVSARVGLDEHLVTLAALAARYPHARRDARALASVGVLRIEADDDGGDAVTLTDAELVSIWGEMRKVGFLEDLDFSPKMLDFYVEAARFVAGWEARTFLDRTEGMIGEEAAAAMIERALPLMLNFFGLLRRKEFMRNIRTGQVAETVLPPPGLAPVTSSERPSRKPRHIGPRSPN
ncbi:MerR family transcriptional regulator [Sphingomonas naphthae]|uniref:MerR family transcriptional regulator n=1 Tax=Sphingomonas naphthae TaxID=1813468 RepID=A0ABY7TNH0_9SPHN|nr:MerR family transcriptional regulator [Sphingomonas naphthae]WCT73769.1 MerR family transcriptional regulator [Sphingomonas naphthae]